MKIMEIIVLMECKNFKVDGRDKKKIERDRKKKKKVLIKD